MDKRTSHPGRLSPSSRPRAHRRPEERGRDPYDGLRPWSAITHGIGAVLALLGTALLLIRAVTLDTGAWRIVSFAIYGASMVCLYTASTLYHCLHTGVRGRIALRKYDHTSIYLLIAGTYTPICLGALRTQGAWGWTLFGITWTLALAGIALTLGWINMPRQLTAAIYLFMGWVAVIALYPLYLTVGWNGLGWLLAGGIFYTVGGVLYALKWPGRDKPRFGCHEIFHIFIVLGSIFHFFLMYRVIVLL